MTHPGIKMSQITTRGVSGPLAKSKKKSKTALKANFKKTSVEIIEGRR